MNILAFFAHPDDETMFTGGTLAFLAEQGAKVHYLCATRGEGGERGEPPLCEIDELGAVREEELNCAVKVLGGSSISFMNYMDPRVGENGELRSFTEDNEKLSRQLTDAINKLQINAVFTHGTNGEYGHPAHVTCNQAAQISISSQTGSINPLLFTVMATYPAHPKPRLTNKDDRAHLVVDIKQVFDRKVSAALCHRTQHALFVRRTSERLGHLVTIPEITLSEESLHRFFPRLNGKLDDPLSKLLIDAGVAQTRIR